MLKGKSRMVEDRLLHKTIYFDNKVKYFFRVVPLVQDISLQTLLVFGAEQYLAARYLCLNINNALHSRI